jgi:RNA polymerase sigma factor (sigma-70 family)
MERTDEQLLRAFLENREESAFTALVRRHGPMVLRVCQSTLKHRQDAEDGFQATFLVLARNASLIQKGQSMSSWLHGVAYRLSMQVKRNAARHRPREEHAKTMPRRGPCEELSWREVEAVLHEEIGRLPAKYKDIFVLCCLQGVSRMDAARGLGLREGTVSSRLAQARKMLQSRLTRRGVSLTSVIGIVALSLPSCAAVPKSLIRATVKTAAAGATATCAAAAHIFTLVEGVKPVMSMSKLKVVTSFLLVMGLVAASMGVFADPLPARSAASHAASDPARKEAGQTGGQPPAVAPTKGESKTIAVKGRVLDPDGKAVVGAKLYLGHYGLKDEVAITEQAKSNADGQFEFSFSKTELSRIHFDQPIGSVYVMPSLERLEQRPTDEADPLYTPVGQVMAIAEGFGSDWARIDSVAESTGLTLRLVKDIPINGRILDQEGKPVVGAKLRLGCVNAYPGEDLKEALAQFRKWSERGPTMNGGGRKAVAINTTTAHIFPTGVKRWGGPLPGQARIVTTGKDGRFHMAGLGGERLVCLHIEGAGIASTDIQLVTRTSDELEGSDRVDNPVTGNTIPIEPKIYGANFRYLAATSRPIRGVVTDKETSKPLAGVMIRVGLNMGTMPLSGDGMYTARTDKEGRFDVLGCPKSPGSGYDIFAQPADAGHYFAVFMSEITDTPGLGPLTANIKLPRGIPIRGKVLDERTGKPVSGARVHYYPLHPNGASIAFADYAWVESSAIADPSGSYTVTALPGPGILGVVAPDSTANTRSKAYACAELTDKQFDDFVKKYELSSETKKFKHIGRPLVFEFGPEELEYADVNVGPLTHGIFIMNSFNCLALLHPSEKDKDLKQDLVLLRPNEGNRKLKDTAVKDKKP